MMNRRSFCAALFAAAGLFTGNPANSQGYPNKPIRVIMPYPPGGGGDLVVLPLIEKLTRVLGQRIFIEHRPGGDTIIGTEMVAKAAPDGYTIGFITDSHSINPLFHKLPYDSLADFAPITGLALITMVLIAHPSIPANNVSELIAYAKANPGKLAYASTGSSSPHYIVMEWLKKIAGIDLLHVAYKGSAAALNAVVANEVQLMINATSTGVTYAKNGRVKAFATTSASRLAVAPDLPTVAEAGFPEFEFSTTHGLVAPGKTPAEIVNRLSEEFGHALRSSDIEERFRTVGLIPAPSTPKEYAAKLRRDAQYYARAVKLIRPRGE